MKKILHFFFIIFFNSLLLLSSFSSSARPLITNILSRPTPLFQAEHFIRALNLLPADPSPQNHPTGVSDSANHGNLSSSKIFERKFDLLSGSSSSVLDGKMSAEELGHHAGYYRLPHTHDARMFYLFFESRHRKNDPVVIWLTGGPGCSSEMALFYENGPFRIADNLSLVLNDFGWDEVSNLIYVDQPTGTGFSYSSDSRDIRHNEDTISNDLYDFLQEFFIQHPDFVENDFYITGESYAGHYIPAFASRVHQGNKANEGIHINLKGLAIGNGLTDPAIQYKAYTDYALDMGLIKESDYLKINRDYPDCEDAIAYCAKSGSAIHCQASLLVCNTIFDSILRASGNVNYYDIRKQCIGDLCYDFSDLEKFLNQKSVRDALGVGNIEFVSCSPSVYNAMLADWMRNLEVGIPALLEDGIKLLVYAGEYDLICNWLGNSRWVHSMEWSGQSAFRLSSELPFIVDNKEAGVLKTYGPLSFLKVHDAGHMVPMDQPKPALEMLWSWTGGSSQDTCRNKQTCFLICDFT